MMQVLPAKYKDESGEYETVIRNDGKTLRMIVRGIEFLGGSFDDFRVKEDLSKEHLDSFTLDKYGELSDCVIECTIPVLIISDQNESEATLLVKLEFGKVGERGWKDEGDLTLVLEYEDFKFQSKRKEIGWLEDSLEEIKKQLPEGHSFKNCFGCAFSDYSVYGHSFFGDMLCFRNKKQEYKAVQGKEDFIKIADGSEERFQETYLCPEFEIRKSGTGYRG
jgi:hypothetical protein